MICYPACLNINQLQQSHSAYQLIELKTEICQKMMIIQRTFISGSTYWVCSWRSQTIATAFSLSKSSSSTMQYVKENFLHTMIKGESQELIQNVNCCLNYYFVTWRRVATGVSLLMVSFHVPADQRSAAKWNASLTSCFKATGKRYQKSVQNYSIVMECNHRRKPASQNGGPVFEDWGVERLRRRERWGAGMTLCPQKMCFITKWCIWGAGLEIS